MVSLLSTSSIRTIVSKSGMPLCMTVTGHVHVSRSYLGRAMNASRSMSTVTLMRVLLIRTEMTSPQSMCQGNGYEDVMYGILPCMSGRITST